MPDLSSYGPGAAPHLRSALRPSSSWLSEFEPPPWLRGSHAQTLAGNFWRRRSFDLPSEPAEIVVDPQDGSRVLCHCHWQPEAAPSPASADRLTILLIHGLEGSSDSGYIRGITSLAWRSGCNVIRMNMRNCGGTESWTPTLYHSGLSADVGAVLRHFAAARGLRRMAMVGYSMGGNLVMKLAGELGQAAPEWLTAAVGVSPATDLAASADALHEPANRLYERHFLRNLMRRFRRKAKLFPAIYQPETLGSVRTIREFDDRITARYSGFTGADDYYFRCSSARVVNRIQIPTLVLHALDDPFIRMMPETRSNLMLNPAVTLVETTHGGHCAFLSRKLPQGAVGFLPLGRHWAETTLMRFLLATAEHIHGS